MTVPTGGALSEAQLRLRIDLNRLRADLAVAKRQWHGSVSSMEGRAKRFAAVAGRVGRMARLALIGVVAGLGGAIYKAAKYEQELAQISTMLDSKSMPVLKEYRKELRALSVEMGESTSTLSRGLYDILSASIAPAKAMDVLRVAARAAAGGLTTTAVAADAITGVLNAYQLSADKAAYVSDILFQTVLRGKTTFDQLAPAIGVSVSLASIAGLKFEELSAAISTMTRQNISTSEAMTALNGILRALTKEGGTIPGAKELMKRLGLSFNIAALQAEGLVGIITKLRGLSLGELRMLAPDIRGLKGLAALIRDYDGYIRDLEGTYTATGAAQGAFLKNTDTLTFEVKRLKAAFVDLFVVIGNIAGGRGSFADLRERIQSGTASLEGGSAAVQKFFKIMIWGTPLVLSAAVVFGVLAKVMVAMKAAFTVAALILTAKIGIIIAAVTALIYGLWKLSERLSQTASSGIQLATSAEKAKKSFQTLITEFKALQDKQDKSNSEYQTMLTLYEKLQKSGVVVTAMFDDQGRVIGLTADSLKRLNEESRHRWWQDMTTAYGKSADLVGELTVKSQQSEKSLVKLRGYVAELRAELAKIDEQRPERGAPKGEHLAFAWRRADVSQQLTTMRRYYTDELNLFNQHKRELIRAREEFDVIKLGMGIGPEARRQKANIKAAAELEAELGEAVTEEAVEATKARESEKTQILRRMVLERVRLTKGEHAAAKLELFGRKLEYEKAGIAQLAVDKWYAVARKELDDKHVADLRRLDYEVRAAGQSTAKARLIMLELQWKESREAYSHNTEALLGIDKAYHAEKQKLETEAATDAKRRREQEEREVQQTAQARLRAYQTMWEGIGRYSQDAHKVNVALIHKQAEEFVKATGDQVTAQRWMHEQLKQLWEAEVIDHGTFVEGLQVGYQRLVDSQQAWGAASLELFTGMVDNMSAAFSDVFYDAFTGQLKEANDYLRDFAKSVLRIITDLFARLMAEKVAMWAMEKIGIAGAAATSITAAAAVGAAWAPAAALASLATLGTNAVPAATALASTVALSKALAATSLIPTMGEGGVVNGPTFALVGERGPEAVIPLKGGRVPVSMEAGVGGPAIHYHFEGATFLDQDTLRRSMATIAVKSVQADYNEGGATRDMIKDGT